MAQAFTQATLGRTGMKVCRLGLSGTYRPGRRAIHHAIDRGVNFFFCYGFDTHVTGVLRDVFKTERQNLVVATGAYNLLVGHPDLRKTLEKRLRQLGTDYIDVFLFLGVTKPPHFPDYITEQLCRFREEGKVRAVGLSCHDRRLVGKLALEGELDALMLRYNAAHRGAEQDIFSHLEPHNPGIISYTATRWSYLVRRMRGWPRDKPIPTPGMCYRFVMSNPSVHVCLSAPFNAEQLDENLDALEQGPLDEEEISLITEYGDFVHSKKKWFM
jgi:aryl-alcohol dehydrogenase-like predicted oxidoreductase